MDYDLYDDDSLKPREWLEGELVKMRQSLELGGEVLQPDIKRVTEVITAEQDGYMTTMLFMAECADGVTRKLRVDITDEPRTDWNPGHYEFEVSEVREK